jgi:fluoroacetyl-CoA thioesterase
METLELIPVGLNDQATFTVEGRHTAAAVGSGPRLSQDGSLEVLATPSLIAFMERLAFNLLESRLPEGASSVGVLVQVSHLVATPLGGRLRVRCEVTVVEGRRVTFKVQAWDDGELVGEGVHQRVIIDRARFSERLQARQESARST